MPVVRQRGKGDDISLCAQAQIDKREEACNQSGKRRLVKEGVVQQRLKVKCPYPGCNKRLCRIDLHLRNVHKMDVNDVDYKR